MSRKTRFDEIKGTIEDFFKDNSQEINIEPFSLREASKSDPGGQETFFYQGEELDVIDMDKIAKNQYKNLRVTEKNGSTINDIVNTSDGFIIDRDNKWYFIEFKDSQIKNNKDSLKNNVLKKAYGNWYMLLDILYNSDVKKRYKMFNYENPVKFAKENVIYILVCSSYKNPDMYTQIKNYSYNNKRYTPGFMQKLKEYLFKDAYVYTEIEFERDFVKKFQY